MRQILSFFAILIFCSCGEQTQQETPIQDKHVHSIDSIEKVDSFQKNKTTVKNEGKLTMLEWENYQDSLRTEILKSKSNKVLKESFFQEMYIRNVVRILNDSLFVTIPFNLHGPDCGAPDCYSTDVSFSIKLDDTLIFPETLQFQEHEYGCVDNESKLSGVFQLVEQTNRHVIYHSTKQKRTLVLFSIDKESGTIAYYFTGVGHNRINGKNVYNFMPEFNEEETNSIYPYTSWVLTTKEYENFLQ